MSFRGRLWTRVLVALAGVALVGAAVAVRSLAARPVPARAPVSLVVLIAVDQLRPDYLDRWRTQLTGGLGWLRTNGVLFTNATQDHALTETAPGHATMLSGRFPAHTNIPSNDLGVEDANFPLLEVGMLDEDGKPLGASPTRFAGTALFDWMRASDPEARALSVSRKDRAAILPIGRARQTVLWYAQGKFTTSTYYADSLPTWVRGFNSRLRMSEWSGRRWSLLLPESAYPEVDDQPWENGGKARVFPHALPTDLAEVAVALEDTPWMDSLTLAAALEGARAMRLGERSTGADLISISLSATDAIGHIFGPDSREVHDQVLRLDRWLGAFVETLIARVPADRIVFVLTADHGVTSMADQLTARGRDAGRVDIEPYVDSVAEALEARWSVDFGFAADNGLLMADTAALSVRGVNVDSLSRAMSARIGAMRGVRRMFTPRTLKGAAFDDAEAGYWRRTLAPSVSWLVAGVPQDNWVFTGELKAQHGSVLEENRKVPILFVVPGTGARSDPLTARTVDIAPTLARLLGIEPLERLDGQALPIATTP